MPDAPLSLDCVLEIARQITSCGYRYDVCSPADHAAPHCDRLLQPATAWFTTVGAPIGTRCRLRVGGVVSGVTGAGDQRDVVGAVPVAAAVVPYGGISLGCSERAGLLLVAAEDPPRSGGWHAADLGAGSRAGAHGTLVGSVAPAEGRR